MEAAVVVAEAVEAVAVVATVVVVAVAVALDVVATVEVAAAEVLHVEVVVAAVAVVAEEEPPPEADAEFIEYLGMWEETDEDWMLLEEIQVADSDERSDPAPEGEESAEKTDES